MVPPASSESAEPLLVSASSNPDHASSPPTAMGDNSPKAHQSKSATPPFAVGIALLIVGGIHVFQAASWHSSVGIVLGVLSLAIGALTILYGLRVQRGTGESAWVLSPRLGKGVVITCTLIFLAFMLIRTWVHHKMPDPPLYGGFPDACPATTLHGCNRVAVHNLHNNSPSLPGMLPFTEFTSQHRVAAVVDAFIASLPRTTVLERESSDSGIFWHARVMTRLWGFADDFFVKVSCEAGLHQSTVEMQGMLRIGDGDMDVNYWRNEALLEALHAAQSAKKLPAEDTC